jgi:diguanylate cyclase (GGDEF)-like protein
MDFHFDPTVSKHTSLVVSTFQTAGTLLIALLLRLLTRGIPGRFLYYWSIGWMALAAAAVCQTFSFLVAPQLEIENAITLRRSAVALYAFFQCAFGFYLWAGCRAYAHGTELGGRDWWLFVVPASAGLVAPMFITNTDLLFPFHSAVLGGFGLVALLTTTALRPADLQTAIGLRMTQAALGGIALLFWHYTLVVGWVLNQVPRPDLEYLHYTALYDGLVEILLGFGMVILGTERVGQPFSGSLAVVDMNDLKKLNDSVGHAAGDAAILHVARSLRDQFRVTDPIFRLGGDEFLVILQGGQSADLAGRMEALDRSLRGLRLPGVTTPVDVVVAWGTADFTSFADFDSAHRQADAAMYECKSRRKSVGVG